MRCVGRCFNSVYEGFDPLQWQSYKYAFPRNFVDCVLYYLKIKKNLIIRPMIRTLHRSLSVLVCILLLNSVSFAQEKETPKTPIIIPTEQSKIPTTKEQKPNTPIVDKKNDGGTGDAGDGKDDGDPKDPKKPIEKPDPAAASSFSSSSTGSASDASPEAKLANQLQDIPINSYIGAPVIGYPLVTLKEVDLTVPISINYNATGMKAHDVASWCGMNWQINGIAFLSRIIRGVPDEGRLDITNLSAETAVARKGYYKYAANNSTSNNTDDSEPDWFFLNIGGSTYKFMIDFLTGKARFFPDADIDVNVTFTYRPDGQGIVGKFSNWIFRMPNGQIYEFSGATGTTENSFEAEANFNFDGHFAFYRNTNLLTSGWYVTKIKGAYGHPIDFTYDNSVYSYYKLTEQYTTLSGGGGHCPSLSQVENKKINSVIIEGATPKKIEGSTLELEFNNCIFCVPPAREDIDYTFSPTSSSTLKLLQNIVVRDKSNPSATAVGYKFEYEYLGQNPFGNEVIPYGYSLSSTANPYHWEKRLFLKRIIMPDTNISYRFHYRGAGQTFPSRFTRGIDHWGLINGYNNSHLIGSDQYTPSNCFTDADRNPSLDGLYNDPSINETSLLNMKAFWGSLEQIDYSLGASTKFYYEPHIANNYNLLIGGVRIKAIKYQDKISGITQIKKYEYLKDDGTSSGFLFFKPLYRFTDLFGYPVSSSSLYAQMLLESSKPAVGYSQVKEIICDSVGVPSLGYTIKNFNQDERDPIVAYDMYRSLGGGAFYLSPSKYIPDHDYFGGTERSSKVYNQTGQLLMLKTQRYEKISDGKYALSLKKVFSSGQAYDATQTYTLNTYKFRLIGDSTSIYDQNGVNPIINSSTLEFGTKHNQAIKSSTIDGRENALETYTRYVADFVWGSDSTAYQACYDYDGNSVDCSDPTVNPAATQTLYNYTPHIPTGSFAKGIYQLQKRYIPHGVVESYTKQAGATIRASLNRYYADSTNEHKSGLLYENYVLENIPSATFNFTTFNRSTDELVKSVDYGQPRSRIESYTNNGQVQKSKIVHGAKTFIKYDSQSILPTCTINNYSDLGTGVVEKGELWTSYEYENRVFGIFKEIMSNGLEIRKEYYPDGKLLCIKDKDGYIIKHYEYLYHGQSTQLSTPNLATDTTYNRIITRTPRGNFTSVSTLDYTGCMISITQLDGSGRTLQSIGFRGSPTGTDMVSSTTYDKFGRGKRSILPIGTSQITGKYVNNHLSLAKSFYVDDFPYTEVTQYEASPLGRVFKNYGAGKAWRDNNKFAQISYLTDGSAIKKYTILSNGDISSSGTYGNNELSVKVMADERGSMVKEYMDKSGNVIQKSVQVDDEGTYINTAFVIDIYGRLRYIVPPKAFVYTLFNETSLPNSTFFEENIYAFTYDNRGRISTKHSPGTGWLKTVYNRLNQAVLTQDSQEAATNKWNFVKFDGNNRSVKTGQFTSTASYETLQGYFDSFLYDKQFEERSTEDGNILQYTNRSFPSQISSLITISTLKTCSFYDDYDWRVYNDYYGSVSDYNFQSNPLNATAYSNLGNYQARGLSTGGYIKDEIYGDFLFPSTVYYDEKNKNIQSIGFTHLIGRNQSDTKYNFLGEVLQNQMIYRKSSANDNIRSIEQSLDHVGRRKDLYYTLKEGTVFKVPRFKMSSFGYDEIGRLKTKAVQPSNAVGSKQTGLWTDNNTWLSGILPTINDPVVINQGHIVTVPTSQTVTAGSLFDKGTLTFQGSSTLQMGTLPANQKGAALQLIEYKYDVRGNMIGTNLDAAGNPQTSEDKLFSYKLDYHTGSNSYFDGSISKQSWKTFGADPTIRAYQFTYDRANRLKSAIYSGGKPGENFSIPNITYDENGNITFMSRMGKNGSATVRIDSLDYQYLNEGNKLKTVTDVAPDSQADGFKNGTNSGDDYEYYADGKLRRDLNRNITLIEYNFLDLVRKVVRSNSDSIIYKYTSTGIKRQAERYIGGIRSYTIYDGEMIYTYTGTNPSLSNFTISEIQNEEGRFVNNHLEYGYTDHLGNLRLSYKDSLGKAHIVHSIAYDGWGMEIRPLRYSLSGALQDRYTWQGKEDLALDGLEDWSDFGWRIEDKALGRWFTPDPADQFQNISPFAYCANNPVSHIDPDGRFIPVIIAIGAVIGAGVNVARNWDAINKGGQVNWGKALAFAAVGGFEGAFIAAAPGAGFARVAASTFGRAVIGGLVKNTANTLLGGRGDISATGILKDAAISALTAGTFSGLGSVLKGGNFFTGARVIPENVIVGQVEKEVLKEGGETVLEWADDFAGRKAGEVAKGSSNVESVISSQATTVYRSVSLQEYQDVLKSGFRGGQNSYSTGKLFASKLSDAKMYGEAFGNQIILKARIPAGTVFEKIYGVDGLKYIYSVPAESLRRVQVLTTFK